MKHRIAKSDLFMIDDALSNEKYERKKMWRGSSTKFESMNPSDPELIESLRDDPSQILNMDGNDMDKLNE
jgi:hypothetical protein